MRRQQTVRLGLLLIPALTILGAAACTDETIVYRDRPVYDDPADGAGEFVGYTLTGDPENVMPSCGNCHVGPTGEWEDTDHAHAWTTLQESGHAQDFCEGCHTVNELGNTQTEAGGYLGSGDIERYKDVQCESCHGPGLPHVASPDGTGPLAPMEVSLDLTKGCGECHQGTHHPFVEQWALSSHAQTYSRAATGCGMQCHSGNGALDSWGIYADYLEKDDFTVREGYMDITCGVCHDPHGGPNESQLRFPVNTNNLDEHLCAQCHNRRSVPDPESSRLSPHSPETDLLRGEAGYFFPGMAFEPGQIIATHGSEGNPRLCAGCHVDNWTITDASGEFAFQAVGHTFQSIPCVGEDGIPSGEENCDLNLDDRYFGSCATSGCHGSEQGALSALVSAADGNRFLAEQLDALLDEVDEGSSPGVITTAEGAEFNYNLARFGAGRGGLLEYTGSAAHNPFLTRALLIASIEAVEEEYGVTPSQAYFDWKAANPDLLPEWAK
jgi:predicted CXXCH cytochrome family protein